MAHGWIKNLKAVTFDVWNTLFVAKSYAQVRIGYLAKILQRNGIIKSTEEISGAYQYSYDYAEKVRQEGNYRFIKVEERLDYILKKLKCVLPEEEKAPVIKYFEEVTLTDGPPLVDGVEETLDLLKSRYQMGIICGSGLTPGRILRTVLKNKDILKYFDQQVFSDEVGYEKPYHIIFEKVLKELKIKPAQAIHIGDLLDTDVAGAKAFGMRTVWYNYEGKPNVTPFKPDFEIRRLLQLIEYLAPGSWKPKKYSPRY
jgi:putative hydrolase of the HAD superfamily